MKMKNLAEGTFLSEALINGDVVYYRANKNNAKHYIHIMKEYTRDIMVIVSNMLGYIDIKNRLYMFT